MIEGVPNSLLWVSYEDIFLRFGFELIRMKLLNISITIPNFKKRQLWFLAKPQFRLCRLNGLRWCPFFNVNAAVFNAWPQNDSDKSVRNIIDCTISNKVRLWRSDTPLRYGVPGGVSCETIPQFQMKTKLKTQIGEVHLHRISKGNCWIQLLSQIWRQDFCC